MSRPVWLGVLAALFLAGAGPSEAQDVSMRAQKLHRQAIVVDTHVDTPQRFVYENFDLGSRNTRGHIDLSRMRQGGLDAIFFSIWVPSRVEGPEAVKRALRQIDSVQEQVRRHPQDLAMATTAAEIRAAHRQGKIAVLMGVEGGHMIDDDLGVLRAYATRGVRYLTLTHSRNTHWADSATDTPKHNGLTEYGKQVVRELNRLGVMVDVSHVSDKTFFDVLTVSRAPVIASHSSVRAISNHARNMSDEMIRALARNGGVIQINYHREFLSQEFLNASRAQAAVLKAREERLEKECGADEACKIRGWEQGDRDDIARGLLPQVPWEKIVEHIDYVVKRVGADYVGLGSDFDGASMPAGMEDCSMLPKITEALLKKGYSAQDIAKILGGNVLRVMEQVEKASGEVQAAEK